MEQFVFLAALLNIASAGINLTSVIVKSRQKKSPNPSQPERD